MNISIQHLFFTALATISIVASIAGCAEVRKLTYSEDFKYVEDKEVKSLMRKMSKSVGKLGQIIKKPTTIGTDQHQLILSELTELENITAKLSAGHTQTNQLFISDHIEQFITDIGTAKMLTKTNPPDYSKIRDIVNNCQACHTLR